MSTSHTERWYDSGHTIMFFSSFSPAQTIPWMDKAASQDEKITQIKELENEIKDLNSQLNIYVSQLLW